MLDEAKNKPITPQAVDPVTSVTVPVIGKESQPVSIDTSLARPMDQEGLPPVEIPKPLESTLTPVVPPQPVLDTSTQMAHSMPTHHVEPHQIDTAHLPQNASKGPSWNPVSWVARIVKREGNKGRLVLKTA